MESKNHSPIRELPSEEKFVGIIGGVGPEAGTLLHRFIIQETAKHKTIERDQDHLMVVHVSASPWISDRTNLLLGKHDHNSAIGAFQVIRIMNDIANSLGRKGVVGVPCNTFHAKPIYDELISMVEREKIENIEILHMIDETKNYIEDSFANIRKIGLMSTTGTRSQKIYHDLLEPLGYELVEVDQDDHEYLHDSIYNQEWGIKAVSPVTDRAKDNFAKYANYIKNKDAEAMILGCTEIPLALQGEHFEKVPLIDPMRALARALVKRAIGK